MTLALCSTSQPKLKHGCVTSFVFLPKPKHSIAPTTMENINCVPDETRTASLDWKHRR